MTLKLKAAVVLSLIACLTLDLKKKTLSQKLIVFTDGYPWGSWGDEDYCDTLFIVHGSGYGGRTPLHHMA